MNPSIRNSLSVLTSVVLAVAVPAQTQSAPADCLPASTWAMASFAGLDRCSEAVKGHAAASLVRSFVESLPEATRNERIDAVLDQVALQLRDGFAQSPLQLAAVRALARRPMAIGMSRLTIQGMAPSLAVVVAEGDAAAEVDAVLLQLVAARPEPTRIKQGSAAGIECRIIEGDAMPSLMAVRQNGVFVLTNSEGYLREILAVQSGKAASLAAGSSLGSQRARLLESPLVEAFVNVAPMLPMFEPLLPYESAEFGRALGIETLGGAYFAAGPSGEGTVETIDLQLRGAEDGLLKAALSKQADFSAAKFFSKDTLAFATLRIDVNAAVDAFGRFCEQMPREVARDMQRDAARDFLRGFRDAGMSEAAVRELFAAIDGSISVGVQIGEGADPTPKALMVAKLRDEKVVARLLAQLRDAMVEQGIEWKVRTQGDIEAHFCSVPLPGGAIQVAPCYAIANGCLVLGSMTKVTLDAVKQRADEATSLAHETDFLAAALADEGAMAFLHLRPGRFCETQWKLVEAWALPQIDAMQAEIGFASEDLPESEAIAKALGSITASLTCDANGLRLRTRGNIGLGGVAASLLAIVDETLRRATSKAN